MGGITSKVVEDMMNDKKQPHTPKVKQVPFDPRSPSDDITRTPITMLNTPDSGIDTTPADPKVVKVVDPRSPNNEVSRTPIIVEKKEASRRPLSLRPATDIKLDSFLLGTNDDETGGESQEDPRSPTSKVPRTPLEDKILELELKNTHSDQKEVGDESHKLECIGKENLDKPAEESTLVKKLFVTDSPTEKIRRPLGVVQSTHAAKTPRDILQAKHCKNVEDEYNKNIQSLLPDQENIVQSNTEFVEDI